eukprot:RCo037979
MHRLVAVQRLQRRAVACALWRAPRFFTTENFAGRLHPALEGELNALRERGREELYTSRQFSEARDTWERVLELEERYYGDDNISIASTLLHLSNACAAVFDLPAQKELLQRVLLLQENNLPPEDPMIAVTLTNLGNCVGAMGDGENHAALLQRALVIKERSLGKEHPELAVTLASLGTAVGALGELARQRELLERAYSISSKHLQEHGGAPDPNQEVQAAVTELYLAKACLEVQDPAMARQHATHAGEVLRQRLGDGEENPYLENVRLIIEGCDSPPSPTPQQQ